MLKKNKSNNNLKHPLKTFENISKMALYQKIQGTFFILFWSNPRQSDFRLASVCLTNATRNVVHCDVGCVHF